MAPAIATTVAPGVAATMIAAVSTPLAATVADTLATAMTLAAAVTCSGMSVFGTRFAAPCCGHCRFSVCLAFTLAMRGGVSEVGIPSLSMAQTEDSCVKTERVSNLAPAHVIAAHAGDVRHCDAGR